MSIKVANNRLISFSSQKFGALYQQLISISDFHRLGKWLVAECEKAQAFRQTKRLIELSVILSGIPVQEYQLIGQFYQGYTHMIQNPHIVFKNVVEKSNTYKSKALIALATLELRASNYDSGIKFCTEAIRQSHNIATSIHAARSIAVVKSAEGFHATALRDLEAIAPLVRYASPIAYYQYLNSLAVELGEAGRIEEAQNVCRITLASPFVFAYPEWRETGNKIALRGYKSRSVVSVLKPALDKDNVVPLPVVESSPSSIQKGRAKVFDLQKWKNKMVKEPNGEDENVDEMDFNELIVKLLQLTTDEEVSEKRLRKIVKSAIKILNEKD